MNGADTGLRPLTADAGALAAEVHGRCSDDGWPASAFESLLATPGTGGWLAFGDRRAIGVALCWLAADEAEILTLGVAPESRRRGAGLALTTTLLAAARAGGAASVVLDVAETNAAARGLYESLGFVEIGRRPGYYQNPRTDALILRLTFAEADL